MRQRLTTSFPHLATALIASVLTTSAVAGGGSTVIYPDATGADIAFRLSRDGSTVLRSYFPTVTSPVRNERWTAATGIVTLPNPSGTPWVASSLNGDGTIVGGRTNPSSASTPNSGVIYDTTTSSFVAGTAAYTSCVVAPSPTGSPKTGTPRFRAFVSKPVTGIDLYRPAIGYVPHSAQYDGATLEVQAADIQSDRCGGSSTVIVGTQLRTRPFLSVEGGSATQLLVNAPDTDGEVLFFSNTTNALLLKTWYTMSDGSRRVRLVRWQSTLEVEFAEIPSGATDITVYGVDDSMNTVVFNATTPAGSPSPLTVWTRDEGFTTANDYLAARGAFPGLTAAAIGISGDGQSMLVSLSNNTIVLYQGLVKPQCGGTESCYTAHSTPGCSNATCCATVCTIDPFCCTNQWDSICVGRATDLCAGCGVPASGSCEESHANPGCNDSSCCQTVCVRDPFCCETRWDAVCVEGALVSCRSGATCAEARLWSTFFTDAVDLDTHGVAPDGVETVCGSNDTIAEWRILRAWCTGVTKISLCDASSLPQQASISVFAECGGTEIACSDTAGNPGTCPGSNSVSLNLYTIAGREYLVRFSMNNGATFASGALQLECVQVCGTGGSCTTEHDTAGCSNGACCETVCNIDPYCCTTRWDAVCVEEANLYCFDPADINRDGVVDAADLALVLSGWGTAGQSDINGDGTTDAADLSLLLANWG
jgi:hypothetical protein